METKNQEGLPRTQARRHGDPGACQAAHGQAQWPEKGSLAGGGHVCHLQCLEQSVSELSLAEKLYLRILRAGALHARRFIDAVKTRVRGPQGTGQQEGQGAYGATTSGPLPPLGLKPGERVMVKPFDEILENLDQNGKYQGLSFTVAQRKYCGNTCTVLKRLEKVFDERRWKLSRIKDTVLLEGVVCDGAGGVFREWDGCDRHCLLWWKEAWLKRIENPPAGGGGGSDG